MKVRLMGILGTLMLAALFGCGNRQDGPPADGGGETPGGSAGKKLTVAAIPKSTGGEFWETVEQGARDAAEELNVELKWEGTLTETEIAEQNKIIENMINLGVDGLALAPLNKKAMRKSVESAVDAGIPVVIFDSKVESDKFSSFVATDNTRGGEVAAERMIELLGDKKGKVMVLRFVQGTGSTEARAEGFIAKAKAAGLDIVADPYPEDGSVAGAKRTAANTFEGLIKNSKLQLDGVFACNLYSALGMVEALEDLRKGGIQIDVQAIGFDSSPKLIEEVQSGLLDSVVSQNPKKMGYLAIETLVKHLRGEQIEKRVDTGVELVTADRLKNEPEIRELVGLK